MWRVLLVGVVCVASMQAVAQSNMVVSTLDGTVLLSQLYSGKTYTHTVAKKDLLPLPNIGIREAGTNEVAFIHAARFYDNPYNQQRALVIVERHSINTSNNRLQDCHICAPEVDVFIFAPQGKAWQLLSRTQKESEILGSWGKSHLKPTAKIVRLSEHQMGMLYQTSYGNQGQRSTDLQAVVLHEHRPIQNVPVAQISYENMGYYGDSSQAFSFEGKYQMSNQADQQGRYVLSIRYSGSNVNQAGKVRAYNVTKRYYWSERQNKFVPLTR